MDKKKLSNAQWHARFLHQAAWTTAIRNYVFNSTTFGSNPRVLEVGCGTCAVLSQIKSINGVMVGIDIDLDFIRFAQEEDQDLQLAQADGHSLPFLSNYFDLVFCHYLLLWIADPVQILREFARVGKPGGRAVIFAEPDYGGRIDYPPALETLGRAQTRGLQLQGADPLAGRKLLQHANSAGLNILETGVLGSQSDPEIDLNFISSEWTVLLSDLSDIVDQAELRKFREADLKAWQAGNRVLHIPTFYLIAEIN